MAGLVRCISLNRCLWQIRPSGRQSGCIPSHSSGVSIEDFESKLSGLLNWNVWESPIDAAVAADGNAPNQLDTIFFRLVKYGVLHTMAYYPKYTIHTMHTKKWYLILLLNLWHSVKYGALHTMAEGSDNKAPDFCQKINPRIARKFRQSFNIC